MARSDPQVNMRMPAELKARIDEAAEASGRSMNAEIVSRLQASFTTNTVHQASGFTSGRFGTPIVSVAPDGTERSISVEELVERIAASVAAKDHAMPSSGKKPRKPAKNQESE